MITFFIPKRCIDINDLKNVFSKKQSGDDYLFTSETINYKQTINNHLKTQIMKKLTILLAVVLSSIGMVSAQSRSSYYKFSNTPGVSSSVYSTPKVTNYNTTYKSADNYQVNQTYRTPSSYTTVNTIRTSMGNNNYMSGTSVYSNGTYRSSSRTSSIDLGGYRMTTTQQYDNSGNIKSSRTRTKNTGW